MTENAYFPVELSEGNGMRSSVGYSQHVIYTWYVDQGLVYPCVYVCDVRYAAFFKIFVVLFDRVSSFHRKKNSISEYLADWLYFVYILRELQIIIGCCYLDVI